MRKIEGKGLTAVRQSHNEVKRSNWARSQFATHHFIIIVVTVVANVAIAGTFVTAVMVITAIDDTYLDDV